MCRPGAACGCGRSSPLPAAAVAVVVVVAVVWAVLPSLVVAAGEWLALRGLHLFAIPVEDNLPTFGVGIG